MEFHLQGPLTDAASAWALIGDTDLLNRIARSPAVEMQIAPDAHAYPEVRGTLIGPSVLRHQFVESDSRWVHHRWYRQERDVRGPVLRKMRYNSWLEEADGGVIPHIHFRADFQNPVVSLVGWPNMQSAERTWAAALRRLPPPDAPVEPRVLRPLPRVVDRGLEAWRQRSENRIVDLFRTHLTTARTPDLTRLRPFALADAWGLDRDDVLMSFLEGTRVGAVELVWMSRCPRCFAGVSTAPSLSDLADHAECVSCRIGFSPTLDEDVEVVFAAHPSLRPKERERFCSLYPADRPEVRMLLTLAPQSEETVQVPLPHGQWRLGAGGDCPDQLLQVERSGRASHRWSPEDSETASVQPGELTLTLHNPTRGRLRVQLAGTPDVRAAVSAARLASYPGYSRLFGPQALSPNVRLSVTGVAILFTDLSGSTAIYETHGDATAFSVVHAHFALLREAVENNGGTQVKTIGDAVMASFSDPVEAIRAGVSMQAAFQQWANSLQLEHPPGLRVGIHFGPALVVHTDQAGLDYFGGTVNLAARTEGQARPGEVVWTRSLHDTAGVAEALEADGLAVEAFTATVKGIEQPVELVRCRP